MANNVLTEEELRSRDPQLTAGPGADPDKGEAPKPLLYGASEYEYVELLNPLSVEFICMFGVSRPQSVPVSVTPVPGRGITRNEQDVRQNYGLDLRNPDHQGRANIVNRVSIPSGRTAMFLGNEAQVVIRQLVNEIMAREGNQLLLADGHARREVEERIIVNRGSVEGYLGRNVASVHDQLQAVKEEPREEAFPDLGSAGTASVTGAEDTAGEHPTGQPGSGNEASPSKPGPSKKAAPARN